MNATSPSPDPGSSEAINILHFEKRIEALSPTAGDCRRKISELRREMDAACDAGHISIAEWRTVLTKIADVQCRIR